MAMGPFSAGQGTRPSCFSDNCLGRALFQLPELSAMEILARVAPVKGAAKCDSLIYYSYLYIIYIYIYAYIVICIYIYTLLYSIIPLCRRWIFWGWVERHDSMAKKSRF